MRVRPETIFKSVSIYFQWNRSVAAALQEASNVELGKARYTELAVLFHVHKFVKEQTRREGFVGNDYVIERDCCHAGLVGQVLETQSSKHWVEIRISDALAFKHEHTRVARAEYLSRSAKMKPATRFDTSVIWLGESFGVCMKNSWLTARRPGGEDL